MYLQLPPWLWVSTHSNRLSVALLVLILLVLIWCRAPPQGTPAPGTHGKERGGADAGAAPGEVTPGRGAEGPPLAPGSTPGMRLQQEFLSCVVKSPPRPLTTQQRRQARAIGRPAGGPLTHALQQVRLAAGRACTRSCVQGRLLTWCLQHGACPLTLALQQVVVPTRAGHSLGDCRDHHCIWPPAHSPRPAAHSPSQGRLLTLCQ